MSVDAMIREAEKSLGLGEPNHIQRWYQERNGNAFAGNFPWCNAAVTYWAVKSGNYSAVNFGTDYAYTVYHAQRFQSAGRWHKDVAGIRRGDIVFFDWGHTDNISAIDHVGIVTGVSGPKVYTIEGNYGNRCGRFTRYASDIAGYGRPAYGAVAKTIKGVDVSSYQSADSYPLDGYDFVVVKATESTTYTNPKHGAQVKRARDAGRVVGHYHFVRPGSMSAQVDYFLRQAKPQPGEFLVLDWEDAGVSDKAKNEFLRLCKSRSGRKTLLYCNVDFWLNKDKNSECGDGLWIAHYGVSAGNPGVQHPWLLHQYTDDPIDKNVARFSSRSAMRKWAGGGNPEEDDEMTPAQMDQLVKRLKEELPRAVIRQDGNVEAPGDNPDNPYWAPATYLRNTLLKLREVEAKLDAQNAVVAELAKALAAVGTVTDADELAAKVGAAVAAKLEALRVSLDVTEG